MPSKPRKGKQKAPANVKPTADALLAQRAQANRDAMALKSRQQSAAVADIGEIPAVVDSDRKELCLDDLALFLTTYFPNTTGLKPFSSDHLRAIDRIQRCILHGGLFVNAFPRGFAKTTICENATIWATLYGHRRFVPVFGAEASSAAGNIDSIKLELSENELLAEDFPEVCHAIRALEGKVQRCHSQTYAGVLTHIEWKADTIVLPTIPGSPASGGIITAHGITAASRGMKHKRPDGTQQRPDFLMIDDPQTDESASTDLQVNKRLGTIRKTLLKLGGHDRKIAAVVNATVIKPNDIVEQLLNPKKFPSWQGERIKMVKSWSKVHETLWLTDYQNIRNTYDANVPDDQQRAHHAATEFYQAHRTEMDAGCEVAWSHCFDPDTEVSAIQHAYNLLIDDGPEVFASECQNEPLEERVENEVERLTADQIKQKLNQKPRGVVPLECTRLVAFIDVQQNVLPWGVMGFGEDFSGAVVEYGHWPEQNRSYFLKREIQPSRSLAGVTKVQGLEAQLHAGLEVLVGQLASQEFKREDGSVMKIEKIAIDYGFMADVIFHFCRTSPHAAILIPSRGLFFGALTRPMRESPVKTGERMGHNWIIRNSATKRAMRVIQFDSNYWKTFVRQRLAASMGGRGCMTLYGDDPTRHDLLVDHLLSERGEEVEAKGRKVVQWELPPSAGDNDFLDVVSGCHVLASMQGVSLKETAAIYRPTKRIKLSELQKQRHGATPQPVAAAVQTESAPPADPSIVTTNRIRLSDIQKQRRAGR